MGTFGEASQKQNDNRRAALDALARSGSEGLNALGGAQMQVRATQNQALDQALGAAAQRGAPEGMQQRIASTISAPADRTVMNLQAAQGRLSADTARRTQNTGSYFDEASAAVPAVEADTARQIALAQWKAAKKNEDEEKGFSELAKWQQEGYAQGLAEAQRASEVQTVQQQLLDEIAGLRQHMPQPVQEARVAPSGHPLSRGLHFAEQEQDTFRNEGLTRATEQAAAGLGMPEHGGIEAVQRQLAGETVRPQVTHDDLRGAYADLGGDPLLAGGLFQPPTASEQLSDLMAEDFLGSYRETGARNVREAAQNQSATDRLGFGDAAVAKARSLGFESPQAMQAAQETPAYAEMKALADDVVLAGESLDDLRYLLSEFAASDPQTVALVLDEYRPYLVSESYIPDE